MKQLLLVSLFLLSTLSSFCQENKGKDYFPSRKNWEKHSPIAAGFDTAKLSQAIRYAIENESKRPRSMEQSQKLDFGKEPFAEAIGAFADRGDPTGLIIHRGYIIAEWGDPSRVDMTHSVTKSFLSTVVGLAVDNGLIKSVDDTVASYVRTVEAFKPLSPASRGDRFFNPFATAHNSKLTWDVMLRQTSDWEGTLWDKPDWADRPDRDSTKWHNRKRNEPGAVFEYNDVRVNALALAATITWKRSLPEVLKKHIMDPIGASGTWKWHGYNNSWIMLNEKPVQSVSGGGHWGGGMFINAYDMARFGLLTLHKGSWNGKRLVSEKWIQQSLTPTTADTGYGYMNFFLNTGKKLLPNAPVSAYMHVGNGSNIIYVDEEHDLVMVIRWIRNNAAVDGVVKRVLEALK